MLWKPYLRSGYADKVGELRMNLESIATDASKLRSDWIRIKEEHPEEAADPTTWKPPSWLFSIDELAPD